MDPYIYLFSVDALEIGGVLRPGVVETMRAIDWDHRSLGVLVDMRSIVDWRARDARVEELRDLVSRATQRPLDRWALRPPILLCPHAQVFTRICGCKAPSLETFRAIARRSSIRFEQMLYVAPVGEQAMAAEIGLLFARAEVFFGQPERDMLRSVA
jgi:hypothetical protein